MLLNLLFYFIRNSFFDRLFVVINSRMLLSIMGLFGSLEPLFYILILILFISALEDIYVGFN